jgi:L-ascorbate metabolism protein UlaG (beta-lactamase superfamily)
MEIVWYGHSCFRLTERGMASVVTDPFDHRQTGYEALKLRAEVVTVSHDSPSHNYLEGVKGSEHIITGPGEFEIGGVFITGIQTNHRSGNDVSPRNTLYLIDYNGVTVAHLGDLNHVPTQTEVEALGTVNVALVPVGDGASLNAAKAAEVISLIEPSYVIPMHYQTPDCLLKLDPVGKFLKEMGLTDVEKTPSLKFSGNSSFSEDTRVVILEYQHG